MVPAPKKTATARRGTAPSAELASSAAWAGVAVVKRAYEIWQERGFQARLLAAARQRDRTSGKWT